MIQNFISKLSPQEKKIFYIACVMITVALMDRIFIGPAMSKIKSYEEEIDKQKGVIQSDLRLLSYRDRILKEEKTFRPYYMMKEQTGEEILASFLKKIEVLASEAKINLIKVNPGETKEKKSHLEYYANIDCEGKLEDVAKFMYAIDTSPDLLKIVKLTVGAKKAGSEEIAASMTVMKVIIDAKLTQEADQLAQQSAAAEAGVTQGGQEGGSGPGGAGGQQGNPSLGPGGVGGNEDAGPGGTQGGPRISVSGGTAANVSKRLSMKTVKADGKPPKEEEVEPIKPSVFERFIKKRVKPEELPKEPESE